MSLVLVVWGKGEQASELPEQLKIKNAKLKITETPDSTANSQEAEACFQKAIAIARKQQAKSLELRATVSLARLWQQQGMKAEAHKLLFEIYSWFTEGFNTKDLQEAKALLEELQQCKIKREAVPASPTRGERVG